MRVNKLIDFQKLTIARAWDLLQESVAVGAVARGCVGNAHLRPIQLHHPQQHFIPFQKNHTLRQWWMLYTSEASSHQHHQKTFPPPTPLP